MEPTDNTLQAQTAADALDGIKNAIDQFGEVIEDLFSNYFFINK